MHLALCHINLGVDMRSLNYVLFLNLLTVFKVGSGDSASFTIQLDSDSETLDACKECLNSGLSFKVTGNRITVRLV